jgi:hypothetical protein
MATDDEVVVTREYVSTQCSDQVADNYLAMNELSRLVRSLEPAGVLDHHTFNAYAPEDFTSYMADRDAILGATGGKLPVLVLSVSFRKGKFDVALLDPLLAKFGLRLYREFDDAGFWGGQ